MITPQQTDLGRRVVYRPPGAGRRYGVISAIYTRRVFVRFDHQHYSRAVNEAYLEFAKRPAETVPRSHGILTSGAARPRRAQAQQSD
jgi:hypothetical protein